MGLVPEPSQALWIGPNGTLRGHTVTRPSLQSSHLPGRWYFRTNARRPTQARAPPASHLAPPSPPPTRPRGARRLQAGGKSAPTACFACVLAGGACGATSGPCVVLPAGGS
eukprot:scaffold393_cov554-Prasinococcus_capsulatus_cf.AAC.4